MVVWWIKTELGLSKRYCRASRLTGLFALLLAVCVLSGCGSVAVTPPPDPEPPAAQSPAPPTPSESPAPSEPPAPSAPPTPQPGQFVFTPQNYPRVDGSTANIPLGQALYQTLLGASAEDAETAAGLFTGTDNAWRALAGGDADLLLVYEPSEETVELLGDREVYAEVESAPIGRDALVFLVNAQNAEDDLTTEQIQGIYSSSITNWNELGGPDAEIVAYQRNENSGSQTLMRKLVMGSVAMAEPVPTRVVGEMGGLVAAVAEYDNRSSAIGYNVYYYVSRMKADPNVKLLSVNGVAPTNDSIQSGEYPFVNDFYAAIRADEPEDSPARILYDWLQSPTGQRLVSAAGYVAIDN
jgi:ABC-type phosphate transport system substrate-binding protein